MILEGYIAKWNTYPKDEIKIRVARPSILAPSEDLLRDYKNGYITWEEYENRFREQILNNPDAMALLITISEMSKIQNVRLICYEKNPPCHRFLLIKIIEEIEEE